jgi:hypothetical protein
MRINNERNMKVTGIKRDDGSKDYSIVHDGCEYFAQRKGQRFECRGMTGTMKEIKDAVEAGTLGGMDEGESSEPLSRSTGGVWDCVNPNALLVLALEKLDCTAMGADWHRAVRESLDCAGYLGPQGQHEVETAQREFSRVGQLGHSRWYTTHVRKHSTVDREIDIV